MKKKLAASISHPEEPLQSRLESLPTKTHLLENQHSVQHELLYFALLQLVQPPQVCLLSRYTDLVQASCLCEGFSEICVHFCSIETKMQHPHFKANPMAYPFLLIQALQMRWLAGYGWYLVSSNYKSKSLALLMAFDLKTNDKCSLLLMFHFLANGYPDLKALAIGFKRPLKY